MTQNIYIASIYSFIPLKRIKKEYRGIITEPIHTPRYELYAKAQCNYGRLKEQDFYYQYKSTNKDDWSQQYTRKVKMSVSLLNYKEDNDDGNGQYYLVVGTGIDKVFLVDDDKTYTVKDICTQQDITFLKKAFYCKGKEGFFYPLNDPQKFMMDNWLNDLIYSVSGVNANNHFSRSYIVDVLVVPTDVSGSDICILNERFEKNFFSKDTIMDLPKVICDCDQWAYGLIFGNDNYYRVPDAQIKSVIRKPFSNNCTDATYASWNTIVLLRTHNPYPFANKYEGKPFSTELTNISNVYEICATMKTKHKLKLIKKMLKCNNASAIKEAIGNIASDIIQRPFGVQELTGKTTYIYEAMGINEDFDAVRRIGELKAEAANIRNTQRLNWIVAALTAATVLIGILQLLTR